MYWMRHIAVICFFALCLIGIDTEPASVASTVGRAVERTTSNEVRRFVEEGSLKRIIAADTKQASGIAVAIYRTEDCSFGVMQAYEYVGYEYRPITPVKTTVG